MALSEIVPYSITVGHLHKDVVENVRQTINQYGLWPNTI
jgi:hypothetical protein